MVIAIYTCLCVVTAGLFMFVSLLPVCSCLLVDTADLVMFVCRYWRLVHVCVWILEMSSCL